VIVCGAFLLFCQIWIVVHGVPPFESPTADFRAFYSAGFMVRTGQASELYDYESQHRVQNQLLGARTAALPFVYPVYGVLPFIPLSLLTYKSAYWVFLGVNVALLLAVSFVLRPYLPALTRLWRPLPAVLILGFPFVAVALLQGQVTMILLLVYCLCFAALERGRSFAAGLLLALGLMKFQIAVPVVLLFAIWRNWRFVAGFASGALGLALISLPLGGSGWIGNYVRSMMTAASTGAVGATQSKYEVFSAKMPNLNGLFFAVSGGAHWGTALVVIASAAVFVWTMRQRPSLPRALVASLLISYHLHMHDLSLLLLPICLIANEAMERYTARAGMSRRAGWKDSVVLAVALLWMVAPLHLWLMGRGWNWVLALAMLPLLFVRSKDLDAPSRLGQISLSANAGQ
jgi:hypothetical protein